MKLCIYFSTIISLAFLSCTQNNTKHELIRSYQIHLNALKIANNTRGQTEIIYNSIKDKIKNPEIAEKATFWYTKTETIKKESDDIYDYIDTLKNLLLNEATSSVITERDAMVNEENKKAVYSIYTQKRMGLQLYSKLKNYIIAVLESDKEIQTEFQAKLGIIGISSKFEENEKEIFINSDLKNLSLGEAFSILSNIQAGIRLNENMLATYCHNKIRTPYSCGFNNRLQPIVTINSSYVKAGEPIEIVAGVGNFFILAEPVIKIDNKTISLNQNDLAIYKINTVHKKGKYLVPVQIQYLTPDGRTETLSKDIAYEVIKDSLQPLTKP